MLNREKLVDLSLPMFDRAPAMPMDPKLSITPHCTTETLGYNLSRIVTSSHQGTHVDAPRHFFENGTDLSQIDPARFICRAICVFLKKEENEGITREDLKPAISRIRPGMAVLLSVGWDKKFPGPEYFKTMPYLTADVADCLAELEIGLLGLDMPTPGLKEGVYVHKKLLGNGILIAEGLAHLERLPVGQEFTFLALPLLISGGDGSPVRAVAFLDAQSDGKGGDGKCQMK